MSQGKRCGYMVEGAMGDMFNSISRPLSPQQIERLREQKVSFLLETRKMVFAGNMECIANAWRWPYDRKSLRQLRNLYDRLHRPERVVKVVEDDGGEVRGALCAFFGAESHLRFVRNPDGVISILGIYRDNNDEITGRKMLAWLRARYAGVRIVAVEVAPDAVGFWNRMVDEVLIDYWTQENYEEIAA